QQAIWARTGVRPSMDLVLEEIDAKMPPSEKLAEYRRATSVARLGGYGPFAFTEVVLDVDIPTPLEGSPSTQWVTRAFRYLDEHVEGPPRSPNPAKAHTRKVTIFRDRLAIGLPEGR